MRTGVSVGQLTIGFCQILQSKGTPLQVGFDRMNAMLAKEPERKQIEWSRNSNTKQKTPANQRRVLSFEDLRVRCETETTVLKRILHFPLYH